jgi:hypothetical protein
MACAPIQICPPSDGSVASCIKNCQCVYCADQTQIDTCTQVCQKGNGAPNIGVNNTAVNNAVNAAQTGIQNALLGPIEAWLPGALERIGLFVFALVLVFAGFFTLK